MSGRAAARGAGALRVELGLLSVGLYAIAGSLAFRVHDGSTPLGVDRRASGLVGSPRLGELAARAHVSAPGSRGTTGVLVGLGVPLAALAAVAGLALVAWHRRDIRSLAMCLLGPASAMVLTDLVLKPLVDRRLGPGLAYPSGHATAAAAVSVLVLVLLHRWRGWRLTAWLAPAVLALPVLTGLALVRLAFHYPTDVVGGTAMGTATVIALAVALNAQQASPSPRHIGKITTG